VQWSAVFLQTLPSFVTQWPTNTMRIVEIGGLSHNNLQGRRREGNDGALPPSLSTGGQWGEVPFHNSITGNVMVYHDRLETNLLQLFAHPEN